MKRFVEGMDRGQTTLFPECLEDWICEDNPVRVIDVFVGGSIWPSFGPARIAHNLPRSHRKRRTFLVLTISMPLRIAATSTAPRFWHASKLTLR